MFIVADLVSLKQDTSLYVGILVFINSFMHSWVEHEKKFYNLEACLLNLKWRHRSTYNW